MIEDPGKARPRPLHTVLLVALAILAMPIALIVMLGRVSQERR